MGLRAPFEQGQADFSRLSSEPGLHLGLVVHRARIEVDEKGTTAAAATAQGVVGMSVRETPRIFILHADRPFLFFIFERASGTILFMGRVVDPGA